MAKLEELLDLELASHTHLIEKQLEPLFKKEVKRIVGQKKEDAKLAKKDEKRRKITRKKPLTKEELELESEARKKEKDELDAQRKVAKDIILRDVVDNVLPFISKAENPAEFYIKFVEEFPALKETFPEVIAVLDTQFRQKRDDYQTLIEELEKIFLRPLIQKEMERAEAQKVQEAEMEKELQDINSKYTKESSTDKREKYKREYRAKAAEKDQIIEKHKITRIDIQEDALELLLSFIENSANPLKFYLEFVATSPQIREAFPGIIQALDKQLIPTLLAIVEDASLPLDERRSQLEEYFNILTRNSPGKKTYYLVEQLENLLKAATKKGDTDLFLILKERQQAIGLYSSLQVTHHLALAAKNLHFDFLDRIFKESEKPEPNLIGKIEFVRKVSYSIEQEALYAAIAETKPENPDQEENRRKIIDLLISKMDADQLSIKGYNGDQYVHCAIIAGDLPTLKALVTKGCSLILTEGYSKNNSLHIALSQDADASDEILEYLITTSPELLTAKNADDKTPIDVALESNNTRALELFLKLKIEIKPSESALYKAALAGNTKTCSWLLENAPHLLSERVHTHGLIRLGGDYNMPMSINAEPKSTYRTDEEPRLGLTALEIAAFNLGNRNRNTSDYRRYAETSISSEQKISALEIFQMLAAKGGEVLTKTVNGLNPIHIAVIRDDVEAIAALVKAFPKLALEPDQYGYNSLHYAALYGNASALDIFTQNLAKDEVFLAAPNNTGVVSYHNNNGAGNILHLAIIAASYTPGREHQIDVSQCLKVCQLCLTKFPDLALAINDKGLTPLNLLLAQYQPNLEILQFLLTNIPVESHLQSPDNILLDALKILWQHKDHLREEYPRKIVEFFKEQHPETYRNLLTKPNAEGVTPINLALQSGDLKFLLECEASGVDLSKLRNSSGKNLLHLIVEGWRIGKKTEVGIYLQGKYPSLKDEKDDLGLRPQDYALLSVLKKGDAKLLEIFPIQTKGVATFESNAALSKMIPCEPGENIAHVAARKENCKMLHAILRENPDLAKSNEAEKSVLEIFLFAQIGYWGSARDLDPEYLPTLELCCQATENFEPIRKMAMTALQSRRTTTINVLLHHYPEIIDADLLRDLKALGKDGETIIDNIIQEDRGAFLRSLILTENTDLLKLYLEKRPEVLAKQGDENPFLIAVNNNKIKSLGLLMEQSSQYVGNLDKDDLLKLLKYTTSEPAGEFISQNILEQADPKTLEKVMSENGSTLLMTVANNKMFNLYGIIKNRFPQTETKEIAAIINAEALEVKLDFAADLEDFRCPITQEFMTNAALVTTDPAGTSYFDKASIERWCKTQTDAGQIPTSPVNRQAIVTIDEDQKGFDEKFLVYKKRILGHLQVISELPTEVAKGLLKASEDIAMHLEKQYDPYNQKDIFKEAIKGAQDKISKAKLEEKALERTNPNPTVTHESAQPASSASTTQTTVIAK